MSETATSGSTLSVFGGGRNARTLFTWSPPPPSFRFQQLLRLRHLIALTSEATVLSYEYGDYAKLSCAYCILFNTGSRESLTHAFNNKIFEA